MIRRYFPHILLTPDDTGSAGASSTSTEESATAKQQTNGAEPTPTNDDAFDAAAEQAIATVQAAATPTADNTQADEPGAANVEQGNVQSLNTTDGETNEDGSPKAGKVDSTTNINVNTNETPEQKAAREAKAVVDKSKVKTYITDKPEDEKLPFHKHERFQQVLAERDTAKTEATQYKQQFDLAKPLVERQQSIKRSVKQIKSTRHPSKNCCKSAR